jgi:hypothetical protein
MPQIQQPTYAPEPTSSYQTPQRMPGSFEAPLSPYAGGSYGYTPSPYATSSPYATPPQSYGSNQDRFLAMVNSGQYQNPQAAIDAFNALNLNADASGLSSFYGSSPAYYSGNNTIGLPGSYLVQGPSGMWGAVQRGPEGPSASSLMPDFTSTMGMPDFSNFLTTLANSVLQNVPQNPAAPAAAPSPAPAPAPAVPSIINNPAFWSSLMQLMSPQSGYTNAPMPYFGGAPYGGYGYQDPNQLNRNAQLQNLLSQVLASQGGAQ